MPDLKKKRVTGSTDLTTEVTDLKWAIMNAVDTFKRESQLRRALAVSFLKGVSSILGAIVTIVIVIPVVVWVLRSVVWPPIIDTFIANIIDQMEQSNHPLPQGAVDQ